MASLQFLGATKTVTGSKHLIQANGKRLMVDCGLFQGTKDLRDRNWDKLPIDPPSVDDIIITHAHIDHTGYLPRLVQQGFSGPVYCTPATADLMKIMLPDSAHLQEEDARWANQKGYSQHTPAMPLYSIDDAQQALKLLTPIDYDHGTEISSGITVTMRDAGHILGSAIVEMTIANGAKMTRVVFSGDLGRPNTPILRDPTPIPEADYLLVESTYGDRAHPAGNGRKELADVIGETTARGGVIVIPSFAVGRTQELLYILRELEEQNEIPTLPVYVDSPMAIDATEIFLKHPEDHDLDATKLEQGGESILRTKRTIFSDTRDKSKLINDVQESAIIISASGMATGGRILHHLAQRLPNKRNTVLFVGFQAGGTRGRAILDGAEFVKIHGTQVPVKAHVAEITSFSAHADYNEIMAWLGGFAKPPKQTFVVHGEVQAAQAMSDRIERQLGWKTRIPEYLDMADLE